MTVVFIVAFLLELLAICLEPRDVSRVCGIAGYWVAALGVALALRAEGTSNSGDDRTT